MRGSPRVRRVWSGSKRVSSHTPLICDVRGVWIRLSSLAASWLWWFGMH